MNHQYNNSEVVVSTIKVSCLRTASCCMIIIPILAMVLKQRRRITILLQQISVTVISVEFLYVYPA
jgi:hypothetical protein